MEDSGLISYITDENNQGDMTADTYNETDALAMSTLSYIRFEDVLGSGTSDPDYAGGVGATHYSDSMTVREYAQAVLDSKILESPAYADDKSIEEKIALVEAIAESDRYDECVIHDFAVADTNNSQWAAFTVDMKSTDGTTTSVVAMRGTDGTTLGWSEDFHLAHDVDGTNAQNCAAQYMRDYGASDGVADNIYMTGHSKGGNDVIAAYTMSDEDVRSRIVHIDNFDGPGSNASFRNYNPAAYAELSDKLTNYYPQDSVIGLLLYDNPGKNVFISSTIREKYSSMWIMGEHDPYSFNVVDGHIVSHPQSELSSLLNKSIDETISGMSNFELEQFANALDKMGIPALIAGDGADWIYSSEDARAALEMIDKYGIVPDIIKDSLDGPAAALCTIYSAVDTFNKMSDDEKIAFLRSAGTLVYHIGENYIGDKADEFISYAKGRLDQAYSTLAGYAEDIRKDIANGLRTFRDGVNDVCDDIADTFTDIYETAKKISNDAWNFGKSIISGEIFDGSAPNTKFFVDLDRLKTEINRLRECVKSVKEARMKIEEIQEGLNFSESFANLAKFTYLKAKLSSEEKKCIMLADSLEKIRLMYEMTEKNLANQ